MHVWLSRLWLVDVCYRVWCKHPHRNFLCDHSLAVTSEGIVEWRIEAVVVVRTGGGEGTVRVRASTGMLSFFVRRIWAEVAFKAVLRARLSEASGTSRLMTLLAADCTEIVSKMASWVAYQRMSCWIGWAQLTIERTLHEVRKAADTCKDASTHAQTCVPCSGMIVKPTCSSLSFTQASGPSELSDAVSSVGRQLEHGSGEASGILVNVETFCI
jgi:hypothetical protein